MSDAILTIESAEQIGKFVELIDITYQLVAHRITTADHDVSYLGVLYTATPAHRSHVGTPSVTDDSAEMELTLPIDHAFVRRYLQMLIPPLRPMVTVRRLYLPTEDIEFLWTGDITSMAVDDDNTEATFRCPPRASEAARRLLPTLAVSRSCPYFLYGPGCNVSRSASVGGLAHRVSATAIYVNGRDVRVDLGSVSRGGTWSELGELVVTSGTGNGDRMSIRKQTDLSPGFSSVADLSMQLPIPGLKNGDSVDVYAGCDHTIDTCRVKFENKDNFGGYPQLPDENPFWWNR